MNISEQGVKFHLTNIFKKTKTKSKIHLLATLNKAKQGELLKGLANSLEIPKDESFN